MSGRPSWDEPTLIRLGHWLRERNYRFTTVTPLTQARVNSRADHASAVDLSGVFGWSRPFSPSLLPNDIFEGLVDANVLEQCESGFRSRVRFSTLGTQLFVHSAYPTNAPDSVFFGPDTVRFVRAIHRHLADRAEPVLRAADIGCGAGPGGIAIAAAAPAAEVWNLDINDAALSLARVNASLNDTPNAIAHHSNILEHATGAFDLIVSNPPYLVDPQHRAYRHGAGRFGEGLSLAILRQSLDRLTEAGSMVLYTGTAVIAGRDLFRDHCRDILANRPCRWSYEEVDPDVFGEELDTDSYAEADRIAVVVLTIWNERTS